jgi:hypothetical protein
LTPQEHRHCLGISIIHRRDKTIGVFTQALVIGGQDFVLLGRLYRESRGLAYRDGHHANGEPGLTVHAGPFPWSARYLLHVVNFAPRQGC